MESATAVLDSAGIEDCFIYVDCQDCQNSALARAVGHTVFLYYTYEHYLFVNETFLKNLFMMTNKVLGMEFHIYNHLCVNP